MGIWSSCKKRGWLPGVRIGLLFLAACALLDQPSVVWQKSVMICMECIGLG